jgi:hypothetical protein
MSWQISLQQRFHYRRMRDLMLRILQSLQCNGMTFLLTWNCRHLANGNLAAKIEQTCEDAGFRAPRILTPEQLMEPP